MNLTLTQNDYIIDAVKDKIEKSLESEIKGVDINDVFGELFTPFSGIGCPAIYGGSDDTCDKVLESLVLHFAKKDNLEKLPECLRHNTLNVLSHLHDLMKNLSKHDSVIFDIINLYKIKRADSNTDINIKEYISWYGV